MAAFTGTQTSVASANTDTTLVAANNGRKGLFIYNDSTAVLYLLIAAGTSSSTNMTFPVPAGFLYVLDFDYKGIVKGIWASVNGSARCTEMT